LSNYRIVEFPHLPFFHCRIVKLSNYRISPSSIIPPFQFSIIITIIVSPAILMTL
jgi:hypothetical protein